MNTGLANDGTKFVNAFLQDGAVPALNVEMASPDCLGSQATVTDEAALGSCCPLPMGGCRGVAGGGYGGGGGGGGIGGSFGGGLLPLGIVGGLTAVGIAAANKKKTEVIVSPVVK